jgi:hypothetical protein
MKLRYKKLNYYTQTDNKFFVMTYCSHLKTEMLIQKKRLVSHENKPKAKWVTFILPMF